MPIYPQSHVLRAYPTFSVLCAIVLQLCILFITVPGKCFDTKVANGQTLIFKK